MDVAIVQRLIQPELDGQRADRIRRGIRAHQHLRGVAGQGIQDKEDDQRRADQRRYQRQKAAENEDAQALLLRLVSGQSLVNDPSVVGSRIFAYTSQARPAAEKILRGLKQRADAQQFDVSAELPDQAACRSAGRPRRSRRAC